MTIRLSKNQANPGALWYFGIILQKHQEPQPLVQLHNCIKKHKTKDKVFLVNGDAAEAHVTDTLLLKQTPKEQLKTGFQWLIIYEPRLTSCPE